MALIKREAKEAESADIFSRFDRMFDEWTRSWPFRGALESGLPWMHDMIRVDEFREDSTLVIRAELPGIDPEKDVELTVGDGMLHMEAHRRSEDKEEGKGYLRREMRYGSFSRTLPLPEGVTDADVSANYKDGVLEVRVSLPESVVSKEPKQIPVRKG